MDGRSFICAGWRRLHIHHAPRTTQASQYSTWSSSSSSSSPTLNHSLHARCFFAPPISSTSQLNTARLPYYGSSLQRRGIDSAPRVSAMHQARSSPSSRGLDGVRTSFFPSQLQSSHLTRAAALLRIQPLAFNPVSPRPTGTARAITTLSLTRPTADLVLTDIPPAMVPVRISLNAAPASLDNFTD